MSTSKAQGPDPRQPPAFCCALGAHSNPTPRTTASSVSACNCHSSMCQFSLGRAHDSKGHCHSDMWCVCIARRVTALHSMEGAGSHSTVATTPPPLHNAQYHATGRLDTGGWISLMSKRQHKRPVGVGHNQLVSYVSFWPHH